MGKGSTNKIGFYQCTGFGWWRESEIAETLRVPGGGDSTKANLVVETLIFDEAQITSPDNGNRPTWGGAATPSIRAPEEA